MGTCFKALSRMSSSPTRGGDAHELTKVILFQSAVAHELFSDANDCRIVGGLPTGFKALSRMSSSPTQRRELRAIVRERFKALSRMSSSPTGVLVHQSRSAKHAFQSAVAHELFSDPLEYVRVIFPLR